MSTSWIVGAALVATLAAGPPAAEGSPCWGLPAGPDFVRCQQDYEREQRERQERQRAQGQLDQRLRRQNQISEDIFWQQQFRGQQKKSHH